MIAAYSLQKLIRDIIGLYKNGAPDHNVCKISINKTGIINDLKERYKIEYEDCKDYLDTFSYRDYLIYETRQITNKIKQQIEKVEYYRKQDMTILLSEYNFLDDYMRIELNYSK